MSEPGDGNGQKSYEIAVATVGDIPDIVSLQRANLISNGGMLSVEFTHDWFEGTIAEMPVMTARVDGQLVGYLISSKPHATANVAVSQAKFRVYPARANSYNYGPICIAASERGQGLASRLFNALRARLPGYEAVAFIRRDNTVSKRTHEQLGFKHVASFSLAGVGYIVVACTH